MRTAVVGVIVGWVFLGAWCARAGADGGSMLLSGKMGGYQITVFTAPTPFRAGPVDISVLVQDSLTGDPMPDPQVTVRMTKPGHVALEYSAKHEAATNKLFRAAQFELPEPGRWDVQVQVEGSHGPVMIRGEVEAARPLPRWREMWPWIGWPALAIALFGIHLVTERRRSGKA
jgi:transposase